MAKVKIIAHPESGQMFTETKNPEWVKCQVRSEEVVVNNGVITLQGRVAFPLVSAKVAAVLSNLKGGDEFPVPGKIITKKSDIEQYADQKEVVNPTTGEAMGYYTTYHFTSNLNDEDIDVRGMDEAEQRVALGLEGAEEVTKIQSEFQTS